MTGVDIVTELLSASADLVARVPIESIKEDALPQGVQLPAILLRDTSSVDRQPLKRGALVRKTDRVAVMVRANSTRERKAVIDLICACCAGRTGNIAGAFGVSVLTAGRGPSLAGPASSFEQTQDFRVSYDAPA